MRKGLMDKSKLRDYGLLNSPLCGKLARGQSIEQNGKVISPEDVMKPPQPGRKISVLGQGFIKLQCTHKGQCHILPLCV